LTTVQIDKTPPVVTITAQPQPPTGDSLPVLVTGKITDATSGVDPATAFFAVKKGGDDEDDKDDGDVQQRGAVTLAADGSYSFTVLIKLSHDGGDDQHQVKIVVGAQDNARNLGTAAATVIVPQGGDHDGDNGHDSEIDWDR
jgi:hypothetical protein